MIGSSALVCSIAVVFGFETKLITQCYSLILLPDLYLMLSLQGIHIVCEKSVKVELTVVLSAAKLDISLFVCVFVTAKLEISLPISSVETMSNGVSIYTVYDEISAICS